MCKNIIKEVDFDNYTDEYEQLLDKRVSFFNRSMEYFAQYKIMRLARSLKKHPSHVLDFGCGIGLSFPYLAKAFPNACIYGTDISKKSLKIAQEKYPFVSILHTLKDYEGHFDCIFVAGVFHHICPGKRAGVMQSIYRLIKPKGTLCIFEHNPFNPITRKIVSGCPYDKGVVLLSPSQLQKTIEDTSLRVIKKSYCLFFPQQLSLLRFFEVYLRWLPLGGQYFLIAQKEECIN
tara:strand:- start:338 stop:1036 length:699 start_codon:yes stop_codon:yes gene_type:complete